ncbi:MAG: chemotaxis protein CheX [unclassified Hahellaceae]|nr:chemotaxis protein CheX [Hahellaceae bacterium]|tara:strand:+ start:33592 stop:34563 length:972 start_codon:yes stop_codon:yes gene_type:complete
MEVSKIVSKVLVHDNDVDALAEIKKICTANNLVGLKDVSQDINAILESNIDLGAVFLAESSDTPGEDALELCRKIHYRHPELPIFLRRDHGEGKADLSPELQNMIAGCYSLSNMSRLQELVDEYVFSTYYPLELARGIQDISMNVLSSIIKNAEISCELPHLVKDQIIYGQLLSLIPLESSWCRGYMMLQVSETEMVKAIKTSHTDISVLEPGFRDINAVLNEATNMIWGGIKTRYFSSGSGLEDSHRTQVPIIVDHLNKFISFGSTEPQLCFRYKLRDPGREIPEITFYQRLIFNLSWSPDKFKESDTVMEDFVVSGELEFF